MIDEIMKRINNDEAKGILLFDDGFYSIDFGKAEGTVRLKKEMLDELGYELRLEIEEIPYGIENEMHYMPGKYKWRMTHEG